MTKRVPFRKCKRCVHYRNGYCTLQDLETCRFKDYDPHRKAKNAFLAFVIVLGVFFISLCIIYLR